MGMAASQSRFLQLTGRKNAIGRELQHLSLEKSALTRSMQAVSREYQASLSAKTLKWSNNSGLTYTDLSYNTLMSPNVLNNNSPVLISDSTGRIVLNDKYAKYAEIISPNGAPGGDYQSNRAKILASIAGVTEEQINTADSTSAEAETKRQEMEEAKKVRDSIHTKTYTEESFINKFLKASTLGIDSEVTSTNAAANAEKIKGAFSGKNYIADDKFTAISDKLDDLADAITGDKKFTADEFVHYMATAFSNVLGDYFLYIDNKGNGTRADYDAADAKYQAALAAYQAAAGVNNQVFTGTEDIQIAFYDKLFTAIAEQGWTHDTGIEDADYLSQMLQNNSYYITTMQENTSDNATSEYIYDLDIASNFDNIFMVNDSNARDEALVKYEYEKSLISSKETKLDTRMKDLELEQSAIVKMMESITKVKNDNIERTYNIFT